VTSWVRRPARRPDAWPRRLGRARGADLRYNMEINLTEAYTGKTAQIRVPSSVTCEQCRAPAPSRARRPQDLRHLRWSRAVRSQSGFFTVERTCPTCQGRGEVISDPCNRLRRPGPRHQGAHAVGQHSRRRRRRHAHPPGRRGRGGPARRAVGRSLHLPVGAPHEFFQRDGADLFCKVPISMTTAALGGEIEVPTIDGKKAASTCPKAPRRASSSA
jgi:molecular chaperone DnaJ